MKATNIFKITVLLVAFPITIRTAELQENFTTPNDLKEMLLSDNYYVDKTMLIKEFLNTPEKLCVIARPRGFGKSLAINTLKRFLQLEIDETGTELPENKKENIVLFKGGQMEHNGKNKTLKPLNIWNETNLVNEYMGKYPLIYINFQDAGNKYSTIKENLKRIIHKLFVEHSYLTKYFNTKEILTKCNTNGETLHAYFMGDFSKHLLFCQSFETFIRLLSIYHKKQIFILVDNYDDPFKHIISSSPSDLPRLKGLFKNMFLDIFNENNKYLKKTYFTGILPYEPDDFSRVDYFVLHTVLDREFSQHFGFTDSEVETLLKAKKQYSDARKYLLEQWYGYHYNGNLIYNPSSIIRYLASGDEECRQYWNNTGTIEILETCYSKDIVLQHSLEQLFNNGHVCIPLQNFISTSAYRWLKRKTIRNKNLFVRVALFTGHLEAEETGDSNDYRVRIPNLEIKILFQKVTSTWTPAD